MSKQIKPDEMMKLLEIFNCEILPWIITNHLSLLDALIILEKESPENFEILDTLWRNTVGHQYIKSAMNKNGIKYFSK